MSEFHFNWEKVWEYSLIGMPMAVLRTLLNRRARTWDALVANFLSAAVIAPLAGMGTLAWLGEDRAGLAMVIAGAASLLGVDLLRGLMNIGEHFARDPVGNLSALRNIWTGKGKKDGGE